MTSLINEEQYTAEQYISGLLKSKQLTGKKFLQICGIPKLKKHCFEMMCIGGADIFAVDEENQTALFRAAESGNLVLLRTLLDLKLDPAHVDNAGENALAVALRCGNRSVAEYLLKICQNPTGIADHEGSSLLHKAAWGNLPELAKLLLDEYGMALETRDHAGRTALHVAAYQGNNRILKYLLDRSANIDAVDNEGKTPIFSGAYDSNIKTVKMLCEKGADLLLKNHDEQTVLEYAVGRKEFEIAKFLNGRSGHVYPGLANAIRAHRPERKLIVKSLAKEMLKITENKSGGDQAICRK